jgi:L,D-transpeptidase ErfK/SrfK
VANASSPDCRILFAAGTSVAAGFVSTFKVLRLSSVNLMRKKLAIGRVVVATVMIAALAAPCLAHNWKDVDFANRPLYAYPLPKGRDNIVGSTTTYTIQKGDTLLDVGRWFGLTSREISDANGKIDWWSPPVGKTIILPTSHILPDGPHNGLVLNIPEMRLYYYYPTPVQVRHKGKLTGASLGHPQVVYTFPVGLGRYDWKTPTASWRVTAKTKDPTWVVPQDIYEEHLERDGEAEHVVAGGDPDNPLGLYRLSLSLPLYAIHGTNIPWGVGMTVSHGCVRLFPEDIERLFSKTKVGTPGRFVYEPVKFGWRGDSLYVEVHEDLYGKYAGLWQHTLQEAGRLGLQNDIDPLKLQKAVEGRTGIPTYVGTGEEPGTGNGEQANSAG